MNTKEYWFGFPVIDVKEKDAKELREQLNGAGWLNMTKKEKEDMICLYQ